MFWMSVISQKRYLKENQKDGKLHHANIKSNNEKITFGYITWDTVQFKAKIIISVKVNYVQFLTDTVSLTIDLPIWVVKCKNMKLYA